MEFTFFIGVDISKHKLDFVVRHGNTMLFHRETENSPLAILALIRELNAIDGFCMEKTVFCMEHTGIYNNHLLGCLIKKKANICLEAAVQIKASLGKLRGKNDKIDAIRISEYAYEKREKLRLWQPKREVVQKLAHLSTIRTRLIKVRTMLLVPESEMGPFIKKGMMKENSQLYRATLKSVTADIAKAEAAIKDVIASDSDLKRLFSLITSVEGIGSVTATEILITTNEFRDIETPKKYACYAGVAPFPQESGKMVKKLRVSHMANKKVKMLLHMSALTAILHNEDLRKYYQRKVEVDKKNKMSVINAVRNKLILRIFACVAENRKYEKLFA